MLRQGEFTRFTEDSKVTFIDFSSLENNDEKLSAALSTIKSILLEIARSTRRVCVSAFAPIAAMPSSSLSRSNCLRRRFGNKPQQSPNCSNQLTRTASALLHGEIVARKHFSDLHPAKKSSSQHSTSPRRQEHSRTIASRRRVNKRNFNLSSTHCD